MQPVMSKDGGNAATWTPADSIDTAARHTSEPQHLRIRIQGPYGSVRFDPFDYPAIILVAGGIGVTPLISLVEAALQRKKPSHLKRQRILLLWSTRRVSELRLFENILTDAICQRGTDDVVEILPRLFLTRGRSENKLRSEAAKKGVVIRPIPRGPRSRTAVTRTTIVEAHIEEGDSNEGDDRDAEREAANVNAADGLHHTSHVPEALVACLKNGRPDIDTEFTTFLASNTVELEAQSPQAERDVNVDPESCCVLACGPWPLVVSAQQAAYNRGFIFHKEIFDL